MLDLRVLDVDRFEGMSPPAGPQRVFGGQVAGQALVAAGRTVDPSRRVHSLHAYFVRPGDPSQPIVYAVDRIRDGRSFSVRRSIAYQYDKPIFFMSASFQRAEQGLEHQMPMPADIAAPESLPSMAQRLAANPARATVMGRARKWPFDVRYVSEPLWASSDPVPIQNQRAWIRIAGRLPDDPLLHACALTFCSDLTLLEATVGRHGEAWGPGGMVGASLDHALWLHRPFRADEWFLYDCTSPSASGARGLAMGHMFTVDGRHIATAVQEGLLRRVGG
ncbi:MAG TPA: acyl-CoA thioesterase II [Micromonosporaceae bacterium]